MTREYLTTPIQRLPEDQRTAQGIFQSDIVVRTAIVAGLADLRENPHLLDYVFASLPKDDMTYRVYGEEQVEVAKKWFLSQEIPVFMNTRVDEAKVPCITISLESSAESAAVLGDVHYQVSEQDTNETPIIYSGPFSVLRYQPSTGIVTMPSPVDVFPGQFLKDDRGTLHEILDVVDEKSFVVAPNLNVPMTRAYIASAPQKRMVTMEQVEFREAFNIGCHALGDPVHLTYLYSIMLFVLLRYKEELLEARGLTRTSVSAGPVTLNTSFNISQPVFTRMITLTGFVHQYWPKFFTGPIVGAAVDIQEVNEDGTLGSIYEET